MLSLLDNNSFVAIYSHILVELPVYRIMLILSTSDFKTVAIGFRMIEIIQLEMNRSCMKSIGRQENYLLR